MARRRLIELFAAEPEVFCRVVGVPRVTLLGFVEKSLPKGRRQLVRVKT